MKSLLKAAVFGVAAMAVASGAQAAAYKAVDVSSGGSVKGKVNIGSAKAENKTYTISKDPEICGAGSRSVPQIEEGSNGGLKNVVVYLDKVKEGKAFPAGLNKITIDQKKCEFVPYFSVMANGGELEAVNSDSTLHNIHTYELIGRARRTVLNVSQPEKGNIVTKKINMRKGVGMKVECDAHDFMHAFVFVASNPYFAKVNDAGEFEIKGIPPGKYEIKTFHGLLGEKEGTVEISAGGSATVDFSY